LVQKTSCRSIGLPTDLLAYAAHFRPQSWAVRGEFDGMLSEEPPNVSISAHIVMIIGCALLDGFPYTDFLTMLVLREPPRMSVPGTHRRYWPSQSSSAVEGITDGGTILRGMAAGPGNCPSLFFSA
jgi:hypothetical protein